MLLKKIIKVGLVAGLAGICTASAGAADLDMYGLCSYSTSGSVTYRASGASQSGRYTNLGAGYYRSGYIRVAVLENYNYSGRSGTISMEFWAMPYYGASTGFIKMTRRIGPLYGGYYYSKLYYSGLMKRYGGYRFPEINVYEYTSAGWRFRDDMLFSKSASL